MFRRAGGVSDDKFTGADRFEARQRPEISYLYCDNLMCYQARVFVFSRNFHFPDRMFATINKVSFAPTSPAYVAQKHVVNHGHCLDNGIRLGRWRVLDIDARDEARAGQSKTVCREKGNIYVVVSSPTCPHTTCYLGHKSPASVCVVTLTMV